MDPFQILVEVSCQPTIELQYRMRHELWLKGSEQEEDGKPALIRAAALKESDHVKLGEEITQRRRSGVPVMIESSTDDLVKVFQMLYMVSGGRCSFGGGWWLCCLCVAPRLSGACCLVLFHHKLLQDVLVLTNPS